MRALCTEYATDFFDEIYFVMTFQWIRLLFFLVFDVIFVGTAGANVALVLLYIAQCLLISHLSCVFFLNFIFILFVAIDLNERTVWKCSHINILTFPWVFNETELKNELYTEEHVASKNFMAS